MLVATRKPAPIPAREWPIVGLDGVHAVILELCAGSGRTPIKRSYLPKIVHLLPEPYRAGSVYLWWRDELIEGLRSADLVP